MKPIDNLISYLYPKCEIKEERKDIDNHNTLTIKYLYLTVITHDKQKAVLETVKKNHRVCR